MVKLKIFFFLNIGGIPPPPSLKLPQFLEIRSIHSNHLPSPFKKIQTKLIKHFHPFPCTSPLSKLNIKGRSGETHPFFFSFSFFFLYLVIFKSRCLRLIYCLTIPTQDFINHIRFWEAQDQLLGIVENSFPYLVVGLIKR